MPQRRNEVIEVFEVHVNEHIDIFRVPRLSVEPDGDASYNEILNPEEIESRQ